MLVLSLRSWCPLAHGGGGGGKLSYGVESRREGHRLNAACEWRPHGPPEKGLLALLVRCRHQTEHDTMVVLTKTCLALTFWYLPYAVRLCLYFVTVSPLPASLWHARTANLTQGCS